jgi:hypothetical protein
MAAVRTIFPLSSPVIVISDFQVTGVMIWAPAVPASARIAIKIAKKRLNMMIGKDSMVQMYKFLLINGKF